MTESEKLNWQERSLYSLASFVNGRAFKTSETRSSSGLPVVKIAELNRGITDGTGRYTGHLDDKHRIRQGDLLFAWSGSIGVYSYRGPEAGLNQHIFKCQAVDDVSQPFLRYLLEAQLPVFQGIVEDKRTTMGHVQIADLKRLTCLVPPLSEQLRIAEVLGTLDDRIESTARLEKVLGETVIAEYGLALADRTDEEVVSLVDAVSLVNGGAYTKGADGTGRMVIRIKELNSGPSDTTVFSSITVPDNKTAHPGDVLFAWSGSLGVWRWYRDEAIVNQHIFKVLPKKHPVWLGWIHILEELERFQDIAAGKATTMGHITKDHLERTMVPTFSAEELGVLSSRVEPLWDAQLQAGRELHTLQAVRAQLLPALVSGELRVVAVEALVEAAT